MSYINPKTDWTSSNIPIDNDFNRIEGNIDHLKSENNTQNGRLDTVESDITNIEGGITSIDGDITTIEGDITDLENALANIDLSDYATEGYVDAAIAGISVDPQQIRAADGVELRVEVRVDDPSSPSVGRMWLVTE